MDQEALDLDNPFWRFSIAVYGLAEVAPTCLRLQDEANADVNLLLLGLWLGTKGIRLSRDEIDDSPGADWHVRVIEPLRAARRAVKRAFGLADPAFVALHAALMRDELAAERIRQAELYRWAERRFAQTTTDAAAAEANLRALAPAARGDEVVLLVKAALAAHRDTQPG